MSAHGHSREVVLVEERVGLLARSEAEVAAAEAAAAERALGAQHAFRQLFRRHPAGVAVVTLVDPILHLPVGFTATSVISVSADPPTLAFSISRGSSSWPALYAAESVVVNFLRAGAEDVSSRFATHGIDRFADVDFARLDTGEPVLDAAASWARVSIVDRHEAGDSALVVGRIEHTQVGEHDPLVFFDQRYHQLRSA